MSTKQDIINHNQKLFRFISPNSNDTLSKMDEKEINELTSLLEDFYLELREDLKIDATITFGLELEFEKAKYKKIERRLKLLPTNKPWIIKEDNSLIEGGEVNSPILKDTKKTWKDLTKVCHLIEKYALIGPNSSTHVHLGTQIFGNNPNTWINFIYTWAINENIIFYFTNGEYNRTRPNITKYAYPLAKRLLEDYKILKEKTSPTPNDILKCIHHYKYNAINFGNIKYFDHYQQKNTVEFRSPNGTLDPVICQNNIYFFIKLIEYAKQNNITKDIPLMKQVSLYHLEDYNKINLKQALNLADAIYQTNLEKLYFLRQYLKSPTPTSNFQLVKTFTKKP